MGDEEFVQTVSIACRLIAELLLMNVVLVVFASQLLFGHEVESSTIYHLPSSYSKKVFRGLHT